MDYHLIIHLMCMGINTHHEECYRISHPEEAVVFRLREMLGEG